MSGGSMDYIYHRVRDAADFVDDEEIRELIIDLSEVLHDLEWWDSGDYGKEDYEKTLSDFKKKWFGASRNERLEKYINESLDKMKSHISKLLGNTDKSE